MQDKKFQPIAMPMNREEDARYAGIRQALMDPPKGYAEYDLARSYGVHIPNQGFVSLAQQGQQDQQQPVPGGVQPNGGIRPDGMLPTATGGGMPTDGGMAAGMPMPSPSMQPMQQNPMQKRGLGRLMAGLAARGGF